MGKNIISNKNVIRKENFALEIYTDSSSTGWGAVWGGGEATHGWWSAEEKGKHINYLELKAIYYVLKCFAHISRSCSILIRADNTTAIAYINRMGSVQYPELHTLTK